MKDTYLADFRTRLLRKEIILAGWLQLPSVDVAEIIADGPVDAVVVDQEHGAIGRREMTDLVRVIEGCGKYPLVRLMSQDVNLARQALDAGCVGLIVPHVESTESFLKFARECSMPTNGSRSIGYFRSNGYGVNFESYLKSAVRPIMIPMIESVAGLSELEDLIEKVKPEAVLIGPYDLSASLGDPGNFASSRYANAVESIIKHCQATQTVAGIHDVTGTAASVQAQVEFGFKFIGCGTDALFLANGIRSAAIEAE